VRFDPADARAPALASVLEDLRDQRNPVDLEIDPVSAFILRVRVPYIVRVQSMAEEASGDVTVMLIRSHTRHVVKRANPDAEELLRTLRAAGNDRQLAVTTTDSGEIIDVRPFDRV
jgi:hypothetical protein